MSDSNRKIITEAIIRMLARREHSVVEILRKLTLKGYDERECVPIVTELRETGVQSDARFAEAKIRSLQHRGVGPVRLKNELSQHDIDEDIINAAIAEADTDWFALALAAKEKKFGLALPEDVKQRQKQMQFLRYRGFTHSQIQYAINGE
ncbi:regulatory protein RecX [Alteromonas pelagimontana]|uniref:Regulatory protein RecX n=1 Tax=Alteromonas pelagimontana TaxID=1858656 RepID=A0A6M4MFL3_9ALTE|nr:regulatory protein RecX [Alteromonas pelagimontana]QJR81889.1 regulatory protein RecX [Alteromonas pelagimontana]